MAKVGLLFSLLHHSDFCLPPYSLSNGSMRFRGIGFYPISTIWWTSLIVSTPIDYIPERQPRREWQKSE
ncbi:MAG: hypothetical protein MUO26_11660 [Methanotrichaceae archaeon]|nr:hypothetical protein [Methanotrichaceae archaeon]